MLGTTNFSLTRALATRVASPRCDSSRNLNVDARRDSSLSRRGRRRRGRKHRRRRRGWCRGSDGHIRRQRSDWRLLSRRGLRLRRGWLRRRLLRRDGWRRPGGGALQLLDAELGFRQRRARFLYGTLLALARAEESEADDEHECGDRRHQHLRRHPAPARIARLTRRQERRPASLSCASRPSMCRTAFSRRSPFNRKSLSCALSLHSLAARSTWISAARCRASFTIHPGATGSFDPSRRHCRAIASCEMSMSGGRSSAEGVTTRKPSRSNAAMTSRSVPSGTPVEA